MFKASGVVLCEISLCVHGRLVLGSLGFCHLGLCLHNRSVFGRYSDQGLGERIAVVAGCFFLGTARGLRQFGCQTHALSANPTRQGR